MMWLTIGLEETSTFAAQKMACLYVSGNIVAKLCIGSYYIDARLIYDRSLMLHLFN